MNDRHCKIFIIASLVLMFFSIPVLAVEYERSKNLKWLIPTPKKCRIKSSLYYSLHCNIINQVNLEKSKLKWLKEELEKIAGIKESGTATAFTILLKKGNTGNKSKEAYNLRIAREGISIEAHSQQGFYRGIGRLLGILSSPLCECLPEGKVKLPEIEIHDWPDFSFRAVKLEMCDIPNATNHQRWHGELKKIISNISMLGFNKVFFEVGGRVKSKSNPEINPARPFEPEKIKELISYAKRRGLEVYPMINCIGHMKRAPQVFPVIDTNKLGRKEPKVMNIAHPQFWQVFSQYLDDIIELFDKPEYFMISTDEFHREVKRLEKITGKAFSDYYPEFLNKVNSLLKKHSVKTVIYHDMLQPRSSYAWPREEANGPVSEGFKALDKLDKNICICYWNHEFGDYPFLDILVKKGFNDIMVQPYYKPDAIRKLAKKAYRMNLKFFGSTWWVYPHRQGYPQLAEYCWNINRKKSKSLTDFDDMNDTLFYSRGTKRFLRGASNITSQNSQNTIIPKEYLKKLAAAFKNFKVNASGVLCDFSIPQAFIKNGMTPPPAIPKPWNFEELKKENKLDKLLISTSSGVETLAPGKVFLNCKRKIGNFVVYTSKFGRSTKTNHSGHEFSVCQDKVKVVSGRMQDRFSEEKGNMKIPAEGLVFSKHGARFAGKNCRISNCFKHTLKTGDQVVLRTKTECKVPAQLIKTELKPDKSNFIIFLSTMYPIERNKVLGELELRRTSGKKEKLTIKSNMFFNCKCPHLKNWNFWMPFPRLRQFGLYPVIAVEFKSNNEDCPREINLRADREGYESGLVLLGGVQYKHKLNTEKLKTQTQYGEIQNANPRK